MKRTVLVTLEISEHENISTYADEILEILQEEGLPVTSSLPWGQASLPPAENAVGQNFLPIPEVPSVSSPDVFDSLSPSDPWVS